MSALGQLAKNAGVDPVQLAKDASIKFGESSVTIPNAAPPPPPPTPDNSNPASDAAAKEQRKGRGKASNILAGSGYGLLSSPYTASRTLLGA